MVLQVHPKAPVKATTKATCSGLIFVFFHLAASGQGDIRAAMLELSENVLRTVTGRSLPEPSDKPHVQGLGFRVGEGARKRTSCVMCPRSLSGIGIRFTKDWGRLSFGLGFSVYRVQCFGIRFYSSAYIAKRDDVLRLMGRRACNRRPYKAYFTYPMHDRSVLEGSAIVLIS